MLTQNAHPYNAWNVSPQPAIGIAWDPSGNSFVGKMIGGDRTVIRAGYSLRKIPSPSETCGTKRRMEHLSTTSRSLSPLTQSQRCGDLHSWKFVYY